MPAQKLNRLKSRDNLEDDKLQFGDNKVSREIEWKRS
jgi:hypothetical protein